MPVVTGKLTDFGLDTMPGLDPQVVFTYTDPAGHPTAGVSRSNVLAARPVVQAPLLNGYFAAELVDTASISPAGYYSVSLEYRDDLTRVRQRDVLPGRLYVPTGGGVLADLLRVPANPALVWVGAEPPANPSPGSWWMETDGKVQEYTGSGWVAKADLRGAAGYNATGAAQDLKTLADYVQQTAGPNAFADALIAMTGRISATAERFPGIDRLGKTDSAPALRRAALATPDGGTLVIPAGTYRCQSTAIDLTGLNARGITVDASAATFVKASDHPVMHFEGGFDLPISVLSTAPATISDDTSATNPGTQLTLAAAPPASWQRGTLIKLVADDVIPGGRPAKTPGEEARLGQYLIVNAVSGTKVTCLGTLRESYKKNVRVARQRTHKVHLIGGVFDTDPNGMQPGGWTSGHVQFRALVGVTFRDYEIRSSPGPAVVYRGCYGYNDQNGQIGYAKNDGSTGNNGYGIMDTSSAVGTITGYRAHRVRHAFTDGSAFLPEDSPYIENYGGTYGTSVQGRAYGTSNVAWDTHSWSEAVTFTDVEAVDCYKGISLRGRKHRVVNGSAIRCYFGGLSIYNEDDGGTSWGHSVDGFTADGIDRRAVEILLNGDGHPEANVRETRRSYLRNILIKNGTVNSVFIRNGSVRIDGLHMVAGAALESTQPIFYARNSIVEVSNWSQDLREVKTGAGHALLRLEAGSEISVGSWDYATTAANASKVNYGIYSTGVENSATVDKLTMSHAPTAGAYNSLSDASRVDWDYRNDGQNSGWIQASAAAVADAGTFGAAMMISRTRAPEIVARLNVNAGAQTLAPLRPGAFRGQRLRLWNSGSSNAVTVRSGSADYLTFLKAGTTALQPNGQILLVWQGTTWWEI